MEGSIKGGSIWLKGFGLPQTWPSKLFTLIITTGSPAIPIPYKVVSTSSSIMEITVPEGLSNQSYSLSLSNPTSQTVNATFKQTTASTPTIQVLNTLPLSSGSQLVRLNRTLITVNPASISIYNILNPTNLISIPSWS